MTESRGDYAKMYCVFAKESIDKMGGNRGKLAAQAGHAYLHSYWDSERRFPSYYGGLGGDNVTATGRYRNDQLAYKICLVVDTVEQLQALHDELFPICGVSLVKDAGLTVFDEPTVTCLGIGPLMESKKPSMMKKISLLK